MTNWFVTLVNTVEPFERLEVIQQATTVQEALDEAEILNEGYYARSASFHSSILEHNYGI